MHILQDFEHYFWEYDISKLDIDLHKEFIIARILSRCDFEDLKKLLGIFAKEVIVATNIKSPNIPNGRKAFINSLLI